jgi:putative protease
MKSVYYAAVTACAYRLAIDRREGWNDEEPAPYKEELYKVSHRELSTGFLFGKEEISKPTLGSYSRDCLFMGTVVEKADDNLYRIDLKNRLTNGEPIEYAGFDILSLTDSHAP